MLKFLQKYSIPITTALLMGAGLATAERIEFVTYYPAVAPGGNNPILRRLDVDIGTVGPGFAATAPNGVVDADIPDGMLLVQDALYVGSNHGGYGTDFSHTIRLGDNPVDVNGNLTGAYGTTINYTYIPPTPTSTRPEVDQEYKFSYEGAGTALALGIRGDGRSISYGYIGGNTDEETAGDDPWMTFTPSGLVGIGTTSPVGELHITTTGINNVQIALETDPGSAADILHYDGTALSSILRMDTDANGATWDFQDRTNGYLSRLFIDGDGDMGILTANPQATLHINGSIFILGGNGDVSQDNSITSLDVRTIVNAINSAGGTGSMAPGAYANADINGDGLVNTSDLSLIVGILNAGAGGPVTNPVTQAAIIQARRDGRSAVSRSFGIWDNGVVMLGGPWGSFQDPHPSASVRIMGTAGGFLPPVMNTGQRNAIADPLAGIFIYNTSINQHEYFNGSVWLPLGGGGNISAPVFDSGWANWTNFVADNGGGRIANYILTHNLGTEEYYVYVEGIDRDGSLNRPVPWGIFPLPQWGFNPTVYKQANILRITIGHSLLSQPNITRNTRFDQLRVRIWLIEQP